MATTSNTKKKKAPARRSGSPAKRAPSGRTTPRKETGVTSVADWKDRPNELPLPSGKVCLCRKPKGLHDFLVQGTIPNALMPIVQKALGGKRPQDEEMAELLKNPEALTAVLGLADHICVSMVVEPKVQPVPLDDDGAPIPMEGRDAWLKKQGRTESAADLLWVDEVDMDDKMFILQYATGGTKDLETFRGQQAERLEALSPSGGDG